MRLNCLPRARREGVRRSALTGERERCRRRLPHASSRVCSSSRSSSRARSAASALPLSRLSAREGLQPHARKHVELADFGTIRSRAANEMEAYEN